ncbi:MAG: hypothetical protein NC938_04210 [Candidatus Omnitrophica bacterium]|nr:hypothetical protein [Candidatus Omnitrophota bacterium]
MRKFLIVAMIAYVSLTSWEAIFAADEAKPKTAPQVQKAPPMPPRMAPQGIPAATGRTNINMLFGSITNIDAKDPSNIKVEIMSETDGKTQIVEVNQATTITKVTDASELKKGENARVMFKRVDDKNVAMGVMFGKIRKLSVPKAAAPAAPEAKSPQKK